MLKQKLWRQLFNPKI